MLNKTLLLAGAAALALAVAGPAVAQEAANGDPVDVCHVPPGNPDQARVITVGHPADTKGHNVDGAADPDRPHLDPVGGGNPDEGGCVDLD
jgi:hypothetical protein